MVIEYVIQHILTYINIRINLQDIGIETAINCKD